MNILEKMEALDFSDAEKQRLRSAVLDDQSLQSRVLLTKAPEIRDRIFWHEAQKAFRVTGFRDGHPKAIQIVLARALEAQRTRTGRHLNTGWFLLQPLYLRSVQLYLHDDMAPLHALLKREDFEGGPGTLTEQIFRCAVNRLPLYEATTNQVRELYELWGFERTDHIDAILAAVSLDSEHVKRMLADGMTAMRRELTSAFEGIKGDLQRQAEKHERELAALRRASQTAREDIENAMARVDSIKAIQRADAKPATAAPPASEKERNPSAQAGKGANSERVLASVEAVQARIESLGRQLKQLRSRFDVIEPTRTQSAAPQLPQFPVTTTTVQALSKWSQTFPDVGISCASIGAAWILLQIVQRSRVILTDKLNLIMGLVKALPGAESRTVVPSPVWTSEADWKEHLAFIAEDVGAPRVLAVLDFDAALQEAYLVPALTAWVSNVAARCSNRVVLVPSTMDLTEVSPRAFELATVLTHNVPYLSELKRLGEMIDGQAILDVPQAPSNVIGYSHSANVSSEDELRRIAANCGVSAPTRVLENFVTLYDGLRGAVGARDAGLIAQQSALLPWIEHARGETVARSVSAALKMVLDGE